MLAKKEEEEEGEEGEEAAASAVAKEKGPNRSDANRTLLSCAEASFKEDLVGR